MISGNRVVHVLRVCQRNIFAVVEDRTLKTLAKLITEKPQTFISRDCWKVYDCLDNYGFEHLMTLRIS